MTHLPETASHGKDSAGKKKSFLAACVGAQSLQQLAPFCPQWSGVVWTKVRRQKRKTFLFGGGGGKMIKCSSRSYDESQLHQKKFGANYSVVTKGLHCCDKL